MLITLSRACTHARALAHTQSQTHLGDQTSSVDTRPRKEASGSSSMLVSPPAELFCCLVLVSCISIANSYRVVMLCFCGGGGSPVVVNCFQTAYSSCSKTRFRRQTNVKLIESRADVNHFAWKCVQRCRSIVIPPMLPCFLATCYPGS